jgi:hypothetical protein
MSLNITIAITLKAADVIYVTMYAIADLLPLPLAIKYHSITVKHNGMWYKEIESKITHSEDFSIRTKPSIRESIKLIIDVNTLMQKMLLAKASDFFCNFEQSLMVMFSNPKLFTNINMEDIEKQYKYMPTSAIGKYLAIKISIKS